MERYERNDAVEVRAIGCPGRTMKQAVLPNIPRSCRRRHASLLLVASLAICGTVVPGLDGSGHRSAYGSTSLASQGAPDRLEILRGREAWLELADAAETEPIEIESSRRVKHSANGTLGGSRSDRPGRSQQKTGGEEGSTLDTGPMPAWMHKKTPAVGSAEWEQEQQETDRQERAVRRAIEGICHGC